jgi:hypothetical protein
MHRTRLGAKFAGASLGWLVVVVAVAGSALASCAQDARSSSSQAASSSDEPWVVLDAPGWTVRKSNGNYSLPSPIEELWFVQYISHPAENRDVAVALSTARGDRHDLEAFARSAPSNVVHDTRVLGHPGLVMEAHYADGTTSGTWLLWQQTTDVWMLFGSSEMSELELSDLAGRLQVVTAEEWRSSNAGATNSSAS